jgi:hypothetical protein
MRQQEPGKHFFTQPQKNYVETWQKLHYEAVFWIRMGIRN